MTDKIGADKDRLARRAAAAMGGWQPGMQGRTGGSYGHDLRVGSMWPEQGLPERTEYPSTYIIDGDVFRHCDGSAEDVFDGALPNPESPATQGCLFARVRELHDMTEAEAVGYILDLMVTRQCGYAEALVIGLEAGR